MPTDWPYYVAAGVLWVIVSSYAWSLFLCPWRRPFRKQVNSSMGER